MPSDKPINTSLLDEDFYKLTMAQVQHALHPDVPVTLSFTNRTKSVRIADVVDIGRLREEFAHCRTLSLASDEIDYLRNCPGYPAGLFSEKYLSFLSTLRLPKIDVEAHDGQFRIQTSGRWPEVTHWETIVLSTVNELYYRELRRRDGIYPGHASEADHYREGRRRLRGKMARIRALPSAGIIEFGTRRNNSASWHEQVLSDLVEGLRHQLLGTSHVGLARKFGIKPIGTFAHEMDMVYSAIYRGSDAELVGSHRRMLEDWRAMYGDQLSVALTDTYGSEFFFRDMIKEVAEQWQWLRHDSGDPFAFGERAIRFYQMLGIDPTTKGIVYSDGLTVDVIEALVKQFDGRIKLAFGWGTDLTNDLGYKALSLVMKAIKACGLDTIKLSDNPEKATGPAALVALFMRLFGYVEGVRVECKY